jgi:cyclopropane fatty-acyl-phospholipid synthase-like methyltransferase
VHNLLLMGLRKRLAEVYTMITQKRVPSSAENKRVPPAAERNKQYIYKILKKLLPNEKNMIALEIASGSGLHVGYLAEKMPHITWTPSDIDQEQWPSLMAYKADHKNINNPVLIDVNTFYKDWDIEVQPKSFHLILCINMIHITPWLTTQGLFRNAGELLHKDGIMVTYGPYSKNQQVTPESNVTFNNQLQAENPAWGIRDIDDLSDESREYGLYLAEECALPANNKLLIFRRNNCLG